MSLQPAIHIHRTQRFDSDYLSFKTLPLADIIVQTSNLPASDAILGAEIYKKWIAANPAHPALYAAYFNYAISLSSLGDGSGAINALQAAIKANPNFSAAFINLGRAFEDIGDTGAAVASWLNLVAQLQPITGEAVKHKILAFHQIARVLEHHEQDAAAEDALRQSLSMSVHQPEAIQHYISLRQRQCKWPAVQGFDDVSEKILIEGISPLSLANLVDDPLFQLGRAFMYQRKTVKPPETKPISWQGTGAARPQKLRIGYVSSDLRAHAVGFAMTDVFETHNKEAFEIYAYYCGIPFSDPIQARIQRSVQHWCDINALTDEAVTQKILDDKIDILIDLNGYTKDARTRVFAHKPAPIIVNWFGFPGTMGTNYHDYIIADDNIIPPSHEKFYSETVLRLPCYQPNDRKRAVGTTPSREAEGLPNDAFVFCCLNGTQKMTARCFQNYLEILSHVDHSVLWLLGSRADTMAHLRAIAEAHGIVGERLIFAEKKPNPEHLARYPLADIFLDTFPYGAHTTAADSLFMGVPVLTMCGQSFAARVCSSLLQAVGLEEFVCADTQSFVAKAIALAEDKDALTKIKHHLAETRERAILFDTPLLVTKLEALFEEMYAAFQNNTLPKPDLRNLETYCEIGAELAVAHRFETNHRTLEADYLERLEYADAICALVPDTRLWR